MNSVSGLGIPNFPSSPNARPILKFTQVAPGLHYAGLGAAGWNDNPSTGYYSEGGYTYYYESSIMGDSIKIVRSPRGSGGQYVQVGSTAYNAILAQIKSGVAKPVSQPPPPVAASTARSYTTGTRAPTASTPSLPSIPSAPSGTNWSAYAPWLVLGVGAVAAIGIVLTGPKGS